MRTTRFFIRYASVKKLESEIIKKKVFGAGISKGLNIIV